MRSVSSQRRCFFVESQYKCRDDRTTIDELLSLSDDEDMLSVT